MNKLLISSMLVAVCLTALANLNVTRQKARRTSLGAPMPIMAAQANDMKQFTSDEKENLGETRQALVMAPDGTLIDRSGQTVSYADSLAIDLASSNVTEIADSASKSAKQAMDRLYGVTNQVADAAYLLRVVIPPLTEREALTPFVVDVVSDGTNDTFYVWYNKQLGVAPTREQTYAMIGETQAVKCVWRDIWEGNNYTVWRNTYNSTNPKQTFNQPTFDADTGTWTCVDPLGGASRSCFGTAADTELRMKDGEGKSVLVWYREPSTVKGWRYEGFTLVRQGHTWAGVHCCTAKRPDFAIGLPCQHIRNDKWGLGRAGFIFGGMTPQVDGQTPYTGLITNRITGEVLMYFKDGFQSRMPNEL